MLEILKTIFIFIEVIILFNILIIAHELGHFLAAKYRGMVVEKFGVWFGKPLWKKTFKGVEFSLGWIPAGGFVSLPQMATMETMEGVSTTDKGRLPKASPLDKIIVAAAGPAASMLVALLCAVAVWIVGMPVPQSNSTTVIGEVLDGGPASKAGLLPGDKILEVNDKEVTRFSGLGQVGKSIMWNVIAADKPEIPIKILRDGKELTLQVKPQIPEYSGIGRKPLPSIGIYPEETPVIAKVLPHSPAENAGLKAQDAILKVNQIPLRSPFDLGEYLSKLPEGQTVTLEIKRKGKILTQEITPIIPEGSDSPKIGIGWDDRGIISIDHPNPFSLVIASVKTMFDTLSAVISPKTEVKAQHLSGPVGIMRIYYLLFEAPDGWRLALWFSVVLNVNLALVNLFPIPVLDGGHITLAIIEAIKRKPLNPRVLEAVQSGFALLIIGYMLYVTFFDIIDLPWKQQLEQAAGQSPPINAPAEIKFSPPNPN